MLHPFCVTLRGSFRRDSERERQTESDRQRPRPKASNTDLVESSTSWKSQSGTFAKTREMLLYTSGKKREKLEQKNKNHIG